LLFLHQYFTDNDATLACATSRRTREGVKTGIKVSVATIQKRPHCELAAQGGAPDLQMLGRSETVGCGLLRGEHFTYERTRT
jgi:hypothetical protein